MENKRNAKDDLDIKQVVENKGYYDKYGEWNSIIRSKKYPGMLFRGRVEVFIFKDNSVYMEIYKDGTYRIPGGSFDIRHSNHDQVYNEAKEESRIIVHNIRYTGISYHKLRKKLYVSKDKKSISWNGTYNKVYTADFTGYYNGKILPYVQDINMYKYGRFYNIDQVYHLLTPEHKLAVSSKIKNIQRKAQ